MLEETFFNDLSFLPFYGIIIICVFVNLITAIFFHELGHWFYFKFNLKKDIKIYFEYNNIWNFKWKAGTINDYNSLTTRQYHDINMVGILAGLIPIIIGGFIYPFVLWLVIPYLFGCKGDIRRMMESAKELPPLEE